MLFWDRYGSTKKEIKSSGEKYIPRSARQSPQKPLIETHIPVKMLWLKKTKLTPRFIRSPFQSFSVHNKLMNGFNFRRLGFKMFLGLISIHSAGVRFCCFTIFDFTHNTNSNIRLAYGDPNCNQSLMLRMLVRSAFKVEMEPPLHGIDIKYKTETPQKKQENRTALFDSIKWKTRSGNPKSFPPTKTDQRL